MNEFKKKLPLTNLGITTIITVFIILSLVTFSSLSYVNALNDLNLSRRIAKHNDEYYEAYNKANSDIASVAKKLDNIYNSQQNLNVIPDEYSYVYPVGNDHNLHVTIIPSLNEATNLNGMTPIQYLESNNLPIYTISRFEVVTTTSWDGDNNTLPVQTIGE